MGYLTKVALGLLASLATTIADDYICPVGKSDTDIVVGAGDSFLFLTQEGEEYSGNTDCVVRYEMGETCKKMAFSCDSFQLGKGDVLFVKTKKNRKFKKTNFKTQSYAGDMVVRFKTNKKKNDIGAQCRMECVKEAAVTTEAPTTPFTEPTTTTGILITAGYKTRTKTAEIYFPSNNTGCSLPDLPEARGGHTQDGELACGGSEAGQSTAERTCVKWENGTWSRSHYLGFFRSQHVSWATASGVYLIGGFENSRTSTLVKENGSVEEGFNLEYATVRACSIPDNENEEVIITGGYSRDFSGYSTKTVSVYSTDGWQRNLPSMQEGRYLHACSSFIYSGRKTLIVTGGYDGSERLDSTEIYDLRGSWQQVQKLPYPMHYISATTFNNRILLFGGPSNEGGVSKAILELDLENNQQAGWRQIGKMMEGRLGPGVTTVSYAAMQDYAQSCT